MIIMLVAYDMWKKSIAKLRKHTDNKWHLKYKKDNEIDTLFDEWVKIFTTMHGLMWTYYTNK